MVDYCAVEYINTTLKMKIRMIDYKGGQKLSKVLQEKVKERRKKQKRCHFSRKNTHPPLFFFYTKKKKDI